MKTLLKISKLFFSLQKTLKKQLKSKSRYSLRKTKKLITNTKETKKILKTETLQQKGYVHNVFQRLQGYFSHVVKLMKGEGSKALSYRFKISFAMQSKCKFKVIRSIHIA